jgi:ankyrin repeat protein
MYQENITGSTALFAAAGAGNLDIMRCLVRKLGTDIN